MKKVQPNDCAPKKNRKKVIVCRCSINLMSCKPSKIKGTIQMYCAKTSCLQKVHCNACAIRNLSVGQALNRFAPCLNVSRVICWSVSKMNELKHEVVYKEGTFTITANITQKALAALLMRSDVQLISVNAPKKLIIHANGRNKTYPTPCIILWCGI